MHGAFDTVTVFNRCVDPATRCDRWVASVVRSCAWQGHVGRAVDGTSALADGGVTLLIGEPELCWQALNYMPPNEWRVADDATRAANFTMQPGDVIARGDWVGDSRSVAALKAALGADAFTVRVVDDRLQPQRRGRHLKVVGV